MKNCTLVEITTKDGLIHQGMYVAPDSPSALGGRKSKTAILYVHGLTSAFYHELPLQDAIIRECSSKGYGYASFNNRGHDFVAGGYIADKHVPKGKKHTTMGAGVEEFSKSIFDIDAGITFLEHKGYTSVILVGHSTGANKVCYYGGTVKDNRVKGIVLASPMSDRLDPVCRNNFFKRLFLKIYIAFGYGDRLYTNLTFFPITPRRVLSLLELHSDEDVFDYGEKSPHMYVYANIKKPMLVIFGEDDEHADRSIQCIQHVFDTKKTTPVYKSIVISKATHGFDGKEDECGKVLVDWIQTSVI